MSGKCAISLIAGLLLAIPAHATFIDFSMVEKGGLVSESELTTPDANLSWDASSLVLSGGFASKLNVTSSSAAKPIGLAPILVAAEFPNGYSVQEDVQTVPEPGTLALLGLGLIGLGLFRRR